MSSLPPDGNGNDQSDSRIVTPSRQSGASESGPSGASGASGASEAPTLFYLAVQAAAFATGSVEATGDSGATSSGASSSRGVEFSLSDPARWNSVFEASGVFEVSGASGAVAAASEASPDTCSRTRPYEPSLVRRLFSRPSGAPYQLPRWSSLLRASSGPSEAAAGPSGAPAPPRRPSPPPGPAQLAISAYEAVRAVHEAPEAAEPRPESPEPIDNGESARTSGRGAQSRRWARPPPPPPPVAPEAPADVPAEAPADDDVIPYLILPPRQFMNPRPPAPEGEAPEDIPFNDALDFERFEVEFERARREFYRIQAADGVEQPVPEVLDLPPPRLRRRHNENNAHRRRPSPDGPRVHIQNPRAVSPHGFPPRRSSDRRYLNTMFTSVGPLSGRGIHHPILPSICNEAYNRVHVTRSYGEWRELESRRFAGITWYFNTRTEVGGRFF